MNDSPEVTQVEEAPVRWRSRRGRRIMGLVLALLLLLLAVGTFFLLRLIVPPSSGEQAAESDANGLIWVRSIYGMTDRPQDQLERAQAAVTAADGTIWVVDGAHRTLMQFSADGRYLRDISGNTSGTLDTPSRFAIGPDGLFYVCETAGDAVVVLDSTGNDAGSFRIPKPVSIAVSDDRIVVGSIAGFAILDKKGQPIRIVGSRGKTDGQFDYVHGVAIGENGNIYVADSFNNRVSAYDKDGKRLWIVRTGNPSNTTEFEKDSITTQEATDVAIGDGQGLQLPLGITLDGAGRVVIVDMFDSTLAVLDSKDGKFLGKYGVIGADDGEFLYPQSVDYDPQRDWFTVADSLNNRVQVVRLPGSSGGGDAASGIRRALSGPLRACIFPFLLLLLAIAAFVVSRMIRRRKDHEPSTSGTSIA